MAYFTTQVASESGGGEKRNSGNGESKANSVSCAAPCEERRVVDVAGTWALGV